MIVAEHLAKWYGEHAAVADLSFNIDAGEVVGLNLDDIDWSTGQITIRGKGGKSAQLPLAADVGTALHGGLDHRHDLAAGCRNAYLVEILLQGLEIDARRVLPADEADQEGFDNVASVLTVSPALLENYLSAARLISRCFRTMRSKSCSRPSAARSSICTATAAKPRCTAGCAESAATSRER